MTETDPPAAAARPAVRQRRRPPSSLMRIVNTVPAVLLRSPLHAPLSKRLLLLGFTGRRSGKAITIPVGYSQTDERTLLLATERPWQRNLTGGAPVTLRLRGRTLRGRSELLREEPALSEAVASMLAGDPGVGRFFGVSLDPDGRPNADQVRAARERGLGVVRIRLDEPVPSS